MTGFVLTGTKSGASAKTLGSYGTYAALSAASIAIETGTWDFALRANKGAAVYRGTVSGKQIVQGENTIAFTLTLSDGSDGKGTVSLVFNLSDDASEKVAAASGSVYAVETNAQVSVTDSVKITANADGTKKITYAAQNIKAGTYLLKVAFYADDGKANLINTWTEIAVVIADAASSAVREIASLNDVYAITYELNGGALAQGTVLQTCYTMFSAFSLPVPTRAGYIFEGWYTNERFAGAPVNVIAKGTTGDLALYARWTGSAITADVQGESDIAVEQVLDAGAVTFTAETGYDSYTWTVNGTPGGTENIFVFDTNALDAAVYEVLLVAKQGETYRSFFALVTVSDVASAPYTVRHWLENADDDGYTLLASDTVTLYGKPATKTVATANDYDGFTAQGFEQKFISRNGTTTVDIYYTRKTVTYTLNLDLTYPDDEPEDNVITGKYGATVSLADDYAEEYSNWYDDGVFLGWIPAMPETFGLEDMTFTAQWERFGQRYYTLTSITTTIGEVTNVEKAPSWTDSDNERELLFSYENGILAYEWKINYSSKSGKEDETIGTGTAAHNAGDGTLALTPTSTGVTKVYHYHSEDTIRFNNYLKDYYFILTYEGEVSYTDADGNVISGYGTEVIKLAEPQAAIVVTGSTFYAITYELNGGVNVVNPENYGDKETTTLRSPTRDGYQFAGWYTTADFSGEPITQITPGHTGSITVYAKWKKRFSFLKTAGNTASRFLCR